MHSEGRAFMVLLEMQNKHHDPAAHHRAELMATHRAGRRSVGRMRRRSSNRGGDS